MKATRLRRLKLRTELENSPANAKSFRSLLKSFTRFIRRKGEEWSCLHRESRQTKRGVNLIFLVSLEMPVHVRQKLRQTSGRKLVGRATERRLRPQSAARRRTCFAQTNRRRPDAFGRPE